LSYLKEILAVCSTGVALWGMYSGINGNLITAIIGFWGVLIGSEIAAKTSKEKD